MGAKVAGTIIWAFAAWLVMGRGLDWLLFERRRNILKGSGYVLIGAGTLVASTLFWIGG